MGIVSIKNNLGGLVISEQYAFSVKNSSGVLLATAVLLCYRVIINVPTKKQKNFWIGILVANILCLLTFRCRSAMTALILIFVIISLRKFNIQYIKKYIISISLAVVLVIIAKYFGFDILQYTYDSFFANKDVTDVDSISSGRISSFDKAISIFEADFIAGNLSQNASLVFVDNYFLNILFKYGIIGAVLCFPIYIALWIISLKGVLFNPVDKSSPYYCLFFLCIVSLFESSYPFGPGTSVVCTYMLWGLNTNK